MSCLSEDFEGGRRRKKGGGGEEEERSLSLMAEKEAADEAAPAEKDDLGVPATVDFDMLCATVALQTQGFSYRKELATEEGGEEGSIERIGGEFGGVQRMWEGDILMDCFQDRRIAIEAACCPCYRFGKNMRRAGFSSCYLHATLYFIFVIAVLYNIIAFAITKRHSYLYIGLASALSLGAYLGYCRTMFRMQFNIRGSGSCLDDCVNHLVCSCCTLCQESRTLEMNNVQDGVWHGRGDAVCLGSKAFTILCNPPLVPPTRSPDPCNMNMERVSNGSQHSWIVETSQSQPLVSSV